MGRTLGFQLDQEEANVITASGCRRSSPVAGDAARSSLRKAAAKQGPALSGRPTDVEEIITVMRCAGDRIDGDRLRGLIVILWRSGLRISEALALRESDLDPGRGAILVRCGKGGKRREVGMDHWGWDQLQPWLTRRTSLPIGGLFCVIHGQSRGRPWSSSAVRTQLRHIAFQAGVRRRFAPHQLRHAHAVEMAREGVPLMIIQRQLGHANLGVTSIYLRASTTPRSSAPSTPAPPR